MERRGRRNEEERTGEMGKRRTTREITLEEYASFQANLDDGHSLTAELLNRIIAMHGFCRIRRPKAEIMEALRSMTLASPFRSTMAQGAAPAPLTLEDLALHVADLNWNECQMNSVSSLAMEVEGKQQLESNPNPSSCSPGLLAPFFPTNSNCNKKRKRTKRVRVANLLEDSPVGNGSCTLALANDGVKISLS
ncbi:uncharacterized protein LOC116262778 [Nymphaea colorata]|nr:uncharacterized protein LOC116262778 [Nymphaea colorata]